MCSVNLLIKLQLTVITNKVDVYFRATEIPIEKWFSIQMKCDMFTKYISKSVRHTLKGKADQFSFLCKNVSNYHWILAENLRRSFSEHHPQLHQVNDVNLQYDGL